MRTVTKLWWLPVLLAFSGHGVGGDSSPSATETDVRALDAQEAEAVLRADFSRLEKLWADDFVVNNPVNAVGLARTGRLRMGGITYSSFVRVPEFVSVRGDIAIIMGHEIVVPKPPSPEAGRSQMRRFSNIWLRTAQGWKLTARHANLAPDLKATSP